jgi:hypothetical protein
VPTGTGADGACHWICVIGTQWVCNTALGCTCPEEENCVPPARAGFSGEKETTPCVPIA